MTQTLRPTLINMLGDYRLDCCVFYIDKNRPPSGLPFRPQLLKICNQPRLVVIILLVHSTNMSTSPGPPKSSQTLEPSARMRLLIDTSHSIQVDRNIPIARYFKSGQEIIKSATACQKSGDIEKAFVLYLRYMSLFLEKLVHHPEWNKVGRDEKKHVREECNNIFDLAEELKARIRDKYEKEYEQCKLKSGPQSDTCDKTSDSEITNLKENPDLDEIDRKFDFSKVPSEGQSSFDINALRESLTSKKD